VKYPLSGIKVQSLKTLIQKATLLCGSFFCSIVGETASNKIKRMCNSSQFFPKKSHIMTDYVIGHNS
jgi:hypothetical protein